MKRERLIAVLFWGAIIVALAGALVYRHFSGAREEQIFNSSPYRYLLPSDEETMMGVSSAKQWFFSRAMSNLPPAYQETGALSVTERMFNNKAFFLWVSVKEYVTEALAAAEIQKSRDLVGATVSGIVTVPWRPWTTKDAWVDDYLNLEFRNWDNYPGDNQMSVGYYLAVRKGNVIVTISSEDRDAYILAPPAPDVPFGNARWSEVQALMERLLQRWKGMKP